MVSRNVGGLPRACLWLIGCALCVTTFACVAPQGGSTAPAQSDESCKPLHMGASFVLAPNVLEEYKRRALSADVVAARAVAMHYGFGVADALAETIRWEDVYRKALVHHLSARYSPEWRDHAVSVREWFPEDAESILRPLVAGPDQQDRDLKAACVNDVLGKQD
jgi:hypothetical protein